MEIFGWIMFILILLYSSAIWLVYAFNYLGKYTIGGAVNTLGDKILTLVGLLILACFDVFVFNNFPFSLVRS